VPHVPGEDAKASGLPSSEKEGRGVLTVGKAKKQQGEEISEIRGISAGWSGPKKFKST